MEPAHDAEFPELKIVNAIQSSFTQISSALEQIRHNLLADVTYYDALEKAAQQICGLYDSPSTGPLCDADIAKHPMALVFARIQASLNVLRSEISSKILPGLRDKLQRTQQASQKFDSFAKSLLARVRRAIQTFETEFGETQASRQSLSTPADFIKDHSDFARGTHDAVMTLFDRLSEIEAEAIKELSEMSEFQRFMQLAETELVAIGTAILTRDFPFLTDVELTPRTVPKEESIEFIKTRIRGLFFDLKSFVGPTRALKHELTGWVAPTDFSPFQARVWSDYAAAPPEQTAPGKEISVKRREAVYVVEAPQAPFWLVQRADGKEGLVPADILEPMERYIPKK
jgi:hypothetical protein